MNNSDTLEVEQLVYDILLVSFLLVLFLLGYYLDIKISLVVRSG